MTDDSPTGTEVDWSSVQGALSQAPALVAVTQGSHHRLRYTNDTYRKSFGQSGFTQPERDRLDDVFATGRSYSDRTSDFTFVYAPLRDSAGRVTGVLVVGVAASRPDSEPERAASLVLQRSLLPQRLHQPDELQVAARYLPGEEETAAGGDWYDVIPIAAGRTALVIGDVMGHGLTAAAVMGQLRSALRAYARLDLPPAEILGLLDAVVAELNPVQIATCLYATFDPVESALCYSSAGHPAPLMRLPDGKVRRMDAQPGAPLGAVDGAYPVQQSPLPPGATVLMYTDGLVERRGQDFDAGVTALADELGGPERPLEELADAILRRCPPEVGADDVALLLARSVSVESAQRTMQLQLNSGEEPARRARAYVNGVLSAWQLPQSLCEDIVIVVGELVVNAVLHSGVAQELRLRRTRHRVVLEVLDRSPRPPRPRPADHEAESGRGLNLVAQLADRWGARPLEGGKSVWCEFLA